MSLLSIADQNRQSAMGSYGQLSQLESNRNNYNEQAKVQNKAKIGSAIGSGIATGMMIGGPHGAVAGAGIALLGAFF